MTVHSGVLKGSCLVQASDDQQLLLLVQLLSDIFMLALHHEWGGGTAQHAEIQSSPTILMHQAQASRHSDGQNSR